MRWCWGLGTNDTSPGARLAASLVSDPDDIDCALTGSTRSWLGPGGGKKKAGSCDNWQGQNGLYCGKRNEDEEGDGWRKEKRAKRATPCAFV